MILILTNSADVTADYLSTVLTNSRVEFFRFDTDLALGKADFQYRVGRPQLRLNDRCIEPQDITHVLYRRPEQIKHPKIPPSPEGKMLMDEWAESLEAFLAHIPRHRWMNHPAHNVGASHKLEQLTTASRLGLIVPDTLVTQDEEELRRFYAKHDSRIIVKPISTGYVEREGDNADSLIYTNRVEGSHLDTLGDMAICPTFFQEEILKCVDVRITIVDNDLHAVELAALDPDGLQRCDIRRDNMTDVIYRAITLPAEIDRELRKLVRFYGLRFAAIDMAVRTTGEWVFFEVNPNGQWAWLDLAHATNIAVSFVKSFSGVYT